MADLEIRKSRFSTSRYDGSALFKERRCSIAI